MPTSKNESGRVPLARIIVFWEIFHVGVLPHLHRPVIETLLRPQMTIQVWEDGRAKGFLFSLLSELLNLSFSISALIFFCLVANNIRKWAATCWLVSRTRIWRRRENRELINKLNACSSKNGALLIWWATDLKVHEGGALRLKYYSTLNLEISYSRSSTSSKNYSNTRSCIVLLQNPVLLKRSLLLKVST